MNHTSKSLVLPPPAFQGEPVTIQVQSVLYNNSPQEVDKALASLGRCAELAIWERYCSIVKVVLGDSSSFPCLNDFEIQTLQKKYSDLLEITYEFFDANLGSAQGHNRLARSLSTDFILIRNPDTIVSPTLLQQLLEPFRFQGIGITEAKQLPFEHPKEYDINTGETSWATTACALTPTSLFKQLGGFDADSFFLYCDDVDYSWRVRYAGYKVIFQPAAVVFHDKRLSLEGHWQPSPAECYYSAEAALILAHKWSRSDLVKIILQGFKNSGNEIYMRAVKVFEKKTRENKLPNPLDSDNQVGQFIDSFYARHRFGL